MTIDIERLTTAVIDCGYRVHVALGPGLLESVYEAVLADSLETRGLAVERQKTIPIVFEGKTLIEGFRADLIVEQTLIVEIKSVEQLQPVHGKQLLTYLRLAHKPIGLLINFNTELYKDGIRRISNNYFGDWREAS